MGTAELATDRINDADAQANCGDDTAHDQFDARVADILYRKARKVVEDALATPRERCVDALCDWIMCDELLIAEAIAEARRELASAAEEVTQ